MSLANSDSLSALSTLGLFRDIILFPGEPERQLWSAKTIPEKCSYEGALQGTYLERESVHVGTQLYTRGYTVVYTRVHSPLLGSRDTLGMSTPRTQILLPCVCMLLGYLAPQLYSDFMRRL